MFIFCLKFCRQAKGLIALSLLVHDMIMIYTIFLHIKTALTIRKEFWEFQIKYLRVYKSSSFDIL